MASAAQDWLRVCEEISGFLTADVGMPLPRSPGATIAFKYVTSLPLPD
jgi:hypothetical protein